MIFQNHLNYRALWHRAFFAVIGLMMLSCTFSTGCKKYSAGPIASHHALGQGTLAVPADGLAYTGAYLASGDAEDGITLEGIEEFEHNVGKHQAIIASSSFWGEQTFPAHNLEIIARHGSIPLIYWSPWDRPYRQNRKPDRFSLTAILAGKWDSYIDRWADGAKRFGRPIFVSWGLEMNGTWFPWSGYFYRGRSLAALQAASHAVKNLGPELYKRTYRYVVDRVRKRGAKNILWVFHANSYSFPSENWNTMAQYYPGSAYVDWLGLSAYGAQFKDESWVTVKDAFYYPYKDICTVDPNKPVMLAEWGVADFPKVGNKAVWLTEAFQMFASQFPRLKAVVFWDERWQNDDNSFSNLRVTSSLESLEAYRQAVAASSWLAYPIQKAESHSRSNRF